MRRSKGATLVLAAVALVATSCSSHTNFTPTPVPVVDQSSPTGPVHQHGVTCDIQPYGGFNAATSKGQADNTGRVPLHVSVRVPFENPQGQVAAVVSADFTLAPGATHSWEGYTPILHTPKGGVLVRVTRCVVHTGTTASS